MSEIIKSTEIIEEKQQKGYYKVVNEYYKEVDDIQMIDGVETVVGKKKIVTGRDVEWVWTDEKELASREIANLKAKLAATDYQAIKYAEGLITAEEYSEMKAQRQLWRDRINELEKVLES